MSNGSGRLECEAPEDSVNGVFTPYSVKIIPDPKIGERPDSAPFFHHATHFVHTMDPQKAAINHESAKLTAFLRGLAVSMNLSEEEAAAFWKDYVGHNEGLNVQRLEAGGWEAGAFIGLFFYHYQPNTHKIAP